MLAGLAKSALEGMFGAGKDVWKWGRGGYTVMRPGRWKSSVRATYGKTRDFIAGSDMNPGNAASRGARKMADKVLDFMHYNGHYLSGKHLPEHMRKTPVGWAARLGSGLVAAPAEQLLDHAAYLGGRAVMEAGRLPFKAVSGTAGAVHGLLKNRMWFGNSTYKVAGMFASNVLHDGAVGLVREGKMAFGLVGKPVLGVAKFGWNMRHDPMFRWGTGLTILGATAAYGAAEGRSTAELGRILPYDEFGAGFTNPSPASNMKSMKVPGESVSATLDNFGASGDLVFALNNLRNSGFRGGLYG